MTSRLNRNLECSPTVHLIQGILEIVELVYIRYHTLDVDLSTVEVRNRSRETEGLREGTNNLPSHEFMPVQSGYCTHLDFVTENLVHQ